MKKILTALFAVFALASSAFAQTDYSLSQSGWVNGPAGTTTYTGTQNLQAGPNAWAISPYTGSTMVGLVPTDNTATFNNMATALGMSADSKAALAAEIAAQNPSGGGTITNAAWIYKDFVFTNPTTFSMYWVYTSTDYVPFNDGSITTFVNTGDAATLAKINGLLKQYILLGATNPGTGNYSTDSYGSTGWQKVNYEVLSNGTYRLGFAAFNQGDMALSPVLYVNDGTGTVTKNGQTFGAVAPNDPNMPDSSGGGSSSPTVVSTTPTDPVVTSSTSYGTPITSSFVLLTSSNSGKIFDVQKITTPVTTTPYTITTVSTPKVIQTWSDNTTTTIDDPNNSATTTTSTGSATTFGSSSTQTAQASAIALREAIAFKNNNLFMIDPLSRKDGSWITPYMSYSKADGSNKNTGVNMGYQKTIDNNTFGFGFQYQNSDSGGYINSKAESSSYSGVGFILTKQNYAWVKGTVGFGVSEYNSNTSIPAFSLFNYGKVKQNNFYSDLAIYSAKDYNGFRPLIGVTLNRSDITNSTESGSHLLSTVPPVGVTTHVNPYAGIRYDYKDIGIETRVTQTKDFKTVAGLRATVDKEIYKNVYLNSTIGVDKGNNYSNVLGTIGVKVSF